MISPLPVYRGDTPSAARLGPASFCGWRLRVTGWWRLVWRLQLDTTEDSEEAGLVLAAPGTWQGV